MNQARLCKLVTDERHPDQPAAHSATSHSQHQTRRRRHQQRPASDSEDPTEPSSSGDESATPSHSTRRSRGIRSTTRRHRTSERERDQAGGNTLSKIGKAPTFDGSGSVEGFLRNFQDW